MFLKEALDRCSELQHETAHFYDALCSESVADDARAAAWRRAAARERRRAGFLESLALLFSALEDEGPFLVQVPLQIDAVRRALESAGRRREACGSHPGCACAETLEAIPGARLYADLIEMAEPEIRRALRLIGSEIRIARSTATQAVVKPEATTPLDCLP